MQCRRTGEGLSIPRIQHRHKRLLRDRHRPDVLHALLALLLLFEEFAFAAHVAAVALCQDVLAEGFDGFSRDDLAADRGLDGDFELVAGDLFAEFGAEGAAAVFGFVSVHDDGECFDGFAVDEDVHLDEVVVAVGDDLVVHGAVAAGEALHLVEEVVDDLGEGDFELEEVAGLGNEGLGFVDAAAVEDEFHDVPDLVLGDHEVEAADGLAHLDDGGRVGEFGGVVDFEEDVAGRGGGEVRGVGGDFLQDLAAG